MCCKSPQSSTSRSNLSECFSSKTDFVSNCLHEGAFSITVQQVRFISIASGQSLKMGLAFLAMFSNFLEEMLLDVTEGPHVISIPFSIKTMRNLLKVLTTGKIDFISKVELMLLGSAADLLGIEMNHWFVFDLSTAVEENHDPDVLLKMRPVQNSPLKFECFVCSSVFEPNMKSSPCICKISTKCQIKLENILVKNTNSKLKLTKNCEVKLKKLKLPKRITRKLGKPLKCPVKRVKKRQFYCHGETSSRKVKNTKQSNNCKRKGSSERTSKDKDANIKKGTDSRISKTSRKEMDVKKKLIKKEKEAVDNSEWLSLVAKMEEMFDNVDHSNISMHEEGASVKDCLDNGNVSCNNEKTPHIKIVLPKKRKGRPKTIPFLDAATEAEMTSKSISTKLSKINGSPSPSKISLTSPSCLKSVRRRIIMDDTPEEAFSCPECGMSFAELNKLEKHKNLHIKNRAKSTSLWNSV